MFVGNIVTDSHTWICNVWSTYHRKWEYLEMDKRNSLFLGPLLGELVNFQGALLTITYEWWSQDKINTGNDRLIWEGTARRRLHIESYIEWLTNSLKECLASSKAFCGVEKQNKGARQSHIKHLQGLNQQGSRLMYWQCMPSKFVDSHRMDKLSWRWRWNFLANLLK